MRRLVISALAVGVVGSLSVVAPATARFASQPASTQVTISVEPCSFSGTAAVTYKRVNGKPTSGVWRVTDRADCHTPELRLAIRGQLLRNGRLVSGFAPGGSCRSEPGAWRCTHADGRGTHRVAEGIAGTWNLRLTMTVRGPDAVRLAQRTGCVYVARSQTATCSIDSPPLRIQ